jgi:hypothetical protein
MSPDPAFHPKPVPNCIFPKRPVGDGVSGLLRVVEPAGARISRQSAIIRRPRLPCPRPERTADYRAGSPRSIQAALPQLRPLSAITALSEHMTLHPGRLSESGHSAQSAMAPLHFTLTRVPDRDFARPPVRHAPFIIFATSRAVSAHKRDAAQDGRVRIIESNLNENRASGQPYAQISPIGPTLCLTLIRHGFSSEGLRANLNADGHFHLGRTEATAHAGAACGCRYGSAGGVTASGGGPTRDRRPRV